jgi:hypothetical protein
MPVQAEYWNGTVWVINGDDSTTKIPASAFGIPSGGTVAAAAQASEVALTAGKGTVTISTTSSTKVKGWAWVTANLASGSGVSNFCADSTVSSAAGTTGADLAGLRSFHGCGTGVYTFDPAARANFGIQTQETKGVVHVREVFN